MFSKQTHFLCVHSKLKHVYKMSVLFLGVHFLKSAERFKLIPEPGDTF